MSAPGNRPSAQADSSLSAIAWVSKSNGTDGGVVLSLSVDPDDIDFGEPVFIDFDGLPVPFFIESHERRGHSKLLVHLTDISTWEDAEEIVGKTVRVQDAGKNGRGNDEEDLSCLVGWTLYRAATPSGENASSSGEPLSGDDGGRTEEVGEITDFIDIPGNPCLEVSTKNEAVLIPLHEDLIISLDPKAGRLVMELPDGLI